MIDSIPCFILKSSKMLSSAVHHLLPRSSTNKQTNILTHGYNYPLWDFGEDFRRSCIQALKALSGICGSLVKRKLEHVGKFSCIKDFTGFKAWPLSLCKFWTCYHSADTHHCPSHPSLSECHGSLTLQVGLSVPFSSWKHTAASTGTDITLVSSFLS